MIIIVEGVDLAGKSYAIERIGKKFNSGITIKNNYKPKANDGDGIYGQYYAILNLAISYNEKDRLVILDRFYPSQAVYSILRGEDEFEYSEILRLENLCQEMNMKIIYLDTPLKILKQRYLERGDEHITIEQLKVLKGRYDAFMALSEVPVLYLNTLEKNWMQRVEKFINLGGD